MNIDGRIDILAFGFRLTDLEGHIGVCDFCGKTGEIHPWGPNGEDICQRCDTGRDPIDIPPWNWCVCRHLISDHNASGHCLGGSDDGGCLCGEPVEAP